MFFRKILKSRGMNSGPKYISSLNNYLAYHVISVCVILPLSASRIGPSHENLCSNIVVVQVRDRLGNELQ